MLKSNICDYKDTYILVRSDIGIIDCNLATEVAFKNPASFIKRIKIIGWTTIDDAEDLDFVVLMYNL